MGNSESNTRKQLEGRPVVVIIGGGSGGIQAAKDLDPHFNVILIDRKNYFFFNIGALRASVDSSFVDKIAIPYDKLLKFGSVVQAEVLEVSSDGVFVHGREDPIKFDYLILATGTSYAFPAKVPNPFAEELPSLYQESERNIKEASDILIIGGGPVGIELLGEIHEKYPEKKIKLIHRQKGLIPGNLSEKFKQEVTSRLEGIPTLELILDDEVIFDEEVKAKFEHRYIKGPLTLKTKNGLEIKTDLAFFCGGSKVNNASFLKNFDSKLDQYGRLKVNQYLQVEGFDNIFGIGDCAGTEPKFSFVARIQGESAAKNIFALDQKRSLIPHKPSAPLMVLPIGPNKGVTELPYFGGMVLGNRVTSLIKGRTLFTPKYWAALNQQLPDDWDAGRFNSEVDEQQVQWFSDAVKIEPQVAKKLLQGLDPIRQEISKDFT